MEDSEASHTRVEGRDTKTTLSEKRRSFRRASALVSKSQKLPKARRSRKHKSRGNVSSDNSPVFQVDDDNLQNSEGGDDNEIDVDDDRDDPSEARQHSDEWVDHHEGDYAGHAYPHHAEKTCTAKFCHACQTNRLKNMIPFTEGKDKMKWARRAFFMSTEKIFPGFIKRAGMQQAGIRESVGVKLRTSVPLKMCLLAHSYFIPIWFLGFLLTQEFATASLKPLHSYVHTSLTYVSVVTDACRLYAGILSNTKDDMQMLALYWMGTVVLQAPIMCFIFATHAFSKYLLPFNVSLDIVLGTILLLEICFGFWHLKGLVSSEIQLLYLSRQMNETSNLWYKTRHFKPKTVNCPTRGPYVDWSTSDEGFSSGNNSDRPHKKTSQAKSDRRLKRRSLSASASFKEKRRKSRKVSRQKT